MAVALAIVTAGCSVTGVDAERSDTPPEAMFAVGEVAYLEDLAVFIVHEPALGVVAYEAVDPMSGCPLEYVVQEPAPFFQDTCDGSGCGLDGRVLFGPSPNALTPFDTYLGVDNHLYIEGGAQPRRDRSGTPIDDPTDLDTLNR